MTVIESQTATEPPVWAVLERQLIDTMDQAAPLFIDKYTRPGGALVWREEYPGDGVWVDDLYESFINWPMYYALGGSDYVGDMAVREWNAITRQVASDYGRISREFVNDDDWFHNGENYIYFYALGLADPTNADMLRRARRFAGFYIGDDPDAPNYDPKHRIIRSPFSGSKGPLFHARFDDVQYNLMHEHVTLGPRYSLPENWTEDEATRRQVHAWFDEVVMQGDVPVNLSVTALVTHAYLLTGEEKYRDWVVEYVEAWLERTRENDGIVPDNIGPNGIVGENRDGQWWGGFYGWAALSSLNMMGSSLTIASQCAQLVTGDARYLELIRSQLEVLMGKAVEQEGRLLVPYRHKDEGWTDYTHVPSDKAIHLWATSMAAEDWQRLEKMRRGWEEQWRTVTSRGPRVWDDRPWVRFLAGDCPHYPQAILQANYQEICRRVAMIQQDDADVTCETGEHHWLERNPIVTEGLVNLTTGGVQPVYFGGLAQGRVRYFDPARQRPGLPHDTAALVSRLGPESMDLTLVNLSPHASRELFIQAGSFGQHLFDRVEVDRESKAVEIGDKVFQVHLRPGTEIHLNIHMQLHCLKPSYAFPWHGERIPFR